MIEQAAERSCGRSVPGRLSVLRIMGRVIATDFPLQGVPEAEATSVCTTIEKSRVPLPRPGSGELLEEEYDELTGELASRLFEGRHGLAYWEKATGHFWIEPSGGGFRISFCPGPMRMPSTTPSEVACSGSRSNYAGTSSCTPQRS